MLRVLTLSTLFPDASRPQFGIFVERQTRALAAQPGVEVEVVAPVGIPPLGRRYPHYRARAALPQHENWHGLSVLRPRFVHWPGTQGRFDSASLAHTLDPLLRRLRGTFRFDVIDTEFFFPDGPAAIALGRRFGVPVSIKARGADIHLWGNARATRNAVVRAGQTADGLLAVSEAMKRDMTTLGMPADMIRVHRTGVDRALFHVRDRAAAKAMMGVEGPLIATVGALIPRKRQSLAVQALSLIPGATLVLIGDGPERGALRNLAERLGVTRQVRFTGSLPPAQVADWLAAADVMVLPSESEGLANAWIEALASGTAVVVTDAGGAREVVNRPEAGRIVNAEQGAIAGAVLALLDAAPDRHAVAATVSAFDWDRNGAELHAHLAGLI